MVTGFEICTELLQDERRNCDLLRRGTAFLKPYGRILGALVQDLYGSSGAREGRRAIYEVGIEYPKLEDSAIYSQGFASQPTRIPSATSTLEATNLLFP